ncbi:MAG: hypothetical protein IJ992_07325, partial [Lentisphaeria bacterium]|nr:hypothetical protein [Lentisphaeria bacterium]
QGHDFDVYGTINALEKYEEQGLLTFLFAAVLTHGAVYEVLPNGGFEQWKNRVPEQWFMLFKPSAHMLHRTNVAQRGNYAAEIRTGKKVAPDTVIFFSGANSGGVGGYPCLAKGVYHLKAQIRSNNHAKIKLYANFRDGGGGFLGGAMSPVHTTLDEWREYSWTIRVPDNEVKKIGCGVIVLSPDNVVKIDNISLTFNTEENRDLPDIYRKVPPPELSLDLQTQGAKLFIDGKETKVIREGLHALTVYANSAKPLKLISQKYPLLERRWRIAPGKYPEAANPMFDDTKWKMAEFHSNGTVKFPDKGDFTLRQVILWNATHHSDWKFLLGTTKDYALPQGAVDTIFAALYTPFQHGMKDWKVTFDLPAGFRFADMTKHKFSNYRVILPRKVEQRSAAKRTIYTLSYPDQNFKRTGYTYLPLVAPEKMSGKPVIRYYRTGNGNFTELPVTIPVRVLPPISNVGRTKFFIGGYEDGSAYPVSREHAELYFRQTARMGMTAQYYNPEYDPFLKQYHKENPEGKLVYTLPGSFPMTLKFWGHIPESVHQMVAWGHQNPGAKVRFLNGKPQVLYKRDIPNNIHYGAFCPSYINGPGKTSFQRKIRELMKKEKAAHPALYRVFIDWEVTPLRPQQSGIWCFCDRCKKAFAAKNNLKKIPTDTEITEKYAKQWNRFRSRQDADTVCTISSALKPIGIEVLFYSQESFTPHWDLNGGIPEIFATVPGNSPATRHRQHYIDKCTTRLCEGSKVPYLVAQRFARLSVSRGPEGWKKVMIPSTDGKYQDLELWKLQIIRMLATCRGGCDLQSLIYYPAGCHYYIAEGIKAVKPYQDLIRAGKRADVLLSSKDIAYPEALVIRKEKEALVLLFNETAKKRNVSFELFGFG